MLGIATYKAQRVQTASNESIVGLLYAEAVRRLDRVLESDGPFPIDDVHHVRSIVIELRAALDPTPDPELVARLRALYDYSLVELSRATFERKVEKVVPVRKVLSTLAEGWDAMLLRRTAGV